MRRTRRKGAGLCGSKVACKTNNGRRNNSRINRPVTHINPLRTRPININILMRNRNAAYNAGQNTSAYNKQIQNYLTENNSKVKANTTLTRSHTKNIARMRREVNKLGAALAKPLKPLTKEEEANLVAEFEKLMLPA